jgi:uncharacterized membrane protein
MFSSTRTARRFGLSALILIGLAAGTAAQAEPMKPQDIEDNRQTCMSACIEKTGNAPRCTSYCDCSIKGLSEQITQEEYEAGKAAISSKQQPAQATVDKLTAIAKTCIAQSQ